MNDNFARFSASLHPFQRILALISIRSRESGSLNRDLIVFLSRRAKTAGNSGYVEIFESDSSRDRIREFVLRSKG